MADVKKYELIELEDGSKMDWNMIIVSDEQDKEQ